MIKAYINYNDPSITIHKNTLCDKANVGPEERIRHVMLNPDFLSKEHNRFKNNKHRFSDEPYMSNMWIILDFQDKEFEIALVGYLKKLIGLNNSTIKNCKTQEHC